MPLDLFQEDKQPVDLFASDPKDLFADEEPEERISLGIDPMGGSLSGLAEGATKLPGILAPMAVGAAA